ncbi:actin-like ATPase domain-containing protein [Dentipellis sp. KUC8613]|nr:actin-like ATPase domain-containing protein [Dentipellis sp. KUC8613]
MSTVPATPRRPVHATHTTTPSTSRIQTAQAAQASPHYQTTRRHSLYGTEDRVVIDTGSTIWKVGFSGEGRPRDVFHVGSLWSLHRAAVLSDREEEDRLLEVTLQHHLRRVFHDSLLTDPKSRKVILVEHPLMPVYIKDMIARILFGNLQVPSISFASSHLLALLAVGRITGLVLDCGSLESTALPIFSARPLFPQMRTTPLAGSRLTAHLRALLLLFGTYLPPPSSLSQAANIPAATRSTRVPQEILTDSVLDEVKTRCCFVGTPMDASPDPEGEHDGMDVDPSSTTTSPPPPGSSTAPSESDFSRDTLPSQFTAASDFDAAPVLTRAPAHRTETHLQALATLYTRHSTATDLHLKVEPPVAQQTGTGRGTLVVPGWIRERGAEVLFEGGDVDEGSVAETVLDALLKVPVDLRKTLASSILVTGGTAMLPGFIPRLRAELIRAIGTSPPLPSSSSSSGLLHRSSSHPPSSPFPSSSPYPEASSSPARRPTPSRYRGSRRVYDRYAPLRPLVPHIAVLNDPSPPPAAAGTGARYAGKAPAFTPATLAWVGGSLAGSLKTGGVEVARERWDEAHAEQQQSMQLLELQQQGAQAQAQVLQDVEEAAARSVIPDWTRTPLPVGAPSARAGAGAGSEEAPGVGVNGGGQVAVGA